MNQKLIDECFAMAKESLEKHKPEIIGVWRSDESEDKKLTVNLSLNFAEQPGGVKVEAGISFSKGKIAEKTQRYFDDKQIGLWT